MEPGTVVVALETFGQMHKGELYRVSGVSRPYRPGAASKVDKVRVAGLQGYWAVGLFRALSGEEIEKVREEMDEAMRTAKGVRREVVRAMGGGA